MDNNGIYFVSVASDCTFRVWNRIEKACKNTVNIAKINLLNQKKIELDIKKK